VGDEDLADLAKIVAGLDDAARHAVAGVDQIKRAVDDQQIGRLRAILGLGSGPPRVPSVISVVSADAWFASNDAATRPASNNDARFISVPPIIIPSPRTRERLNARNFSRLIPAK
jgi:hypothetical protein